MVVVKDNASNLTGLRRSDIGTLIRQITPPKVYVIESIDPVVLIELNESLAVPSGRA